MTRLRTIAAFSVAPAIPSVITGWPFDQRGIGFVVMSAAIAYLYTVCFSLPVYFWLRKRYKLQFLPVCAAAFLVGFIPTLVLFLLLPNPDQASVGGVVTIKDGVRTLAGYTSIMKLATTFGLWGLASGVLWWLIAPPNNSIDR